jgi:hypothetical protein
MRALALLAVFGRMISAAAAAAARVTLDVRLPERNKTINSTTLPRSSSLSPLSTYAVFETGLSMGKFDDGRRARVLVQYTLCRSWRLAFIAITKVHRSYKEGIAKPRVVFLSAGRHVENGTKQ